MSKDRDTESINEDCSPDTYCLSINDKIIVDTAIQLLHKIFRASITRPAQLVFVAKALHVLTRLLRELKKVDTQNSSAAWVEFSKKLCRLLKDAIRLKKKDLLESKYQSLRARLDQRLDCLIEMPWQDADVKRLVKRLRRYRQTFFTFLDQDEVPSDNNRAEREIRPAVIIRKNSHGNRSGNGADTQAILMSVYRTLKLRGLDPLDTIVAALKTYVITGALPPLPQGKPSVG